MTVLFVAQRASGNAIFGPQLYAGAAYIRLKGFARMFTRMANAPAPSPGPPPPPPPPSPPGVFAPTLALHGTSAGTFPYSAAVYPMRGELPTGNRVTSADDSTLATSVLSTYDDGSAAVVVLAGNITVAAGQSKLLALAGSSSAASTALTTARITTVMAGSIVVDFTATYGGAATLSSYTAPERIWWANSQVICARYKLPAPTPGSTKLEAVIDIHAYAGSARAFVEVVVENGKVTIGSATAPADADYTGATITVAGTLIATVSKPASVTVRGVALYSAALHQQFRAFYASAWVGGDPGIATTHESAYLQNHPLFMQIDQPSDRDFAHVDQAGFGNIPGTMTYTPWTIADNRPSMAAGGDDVSIGPFTKWDAQYIQTGNKDARNAVIVNALAVLSYPINYRDATTGVLPTLDQTLTSAVWRGAGGVPQLTYGSGTPASFPYWEEEHAPTVGLVAFLCRPSPVFIEIAQKAAFFALTYQNPDKIFGYDAGRHKAWTTRNATHAAFLTPSALPAGGARATSEVTNWRSATKDAIGRAITNHYNGWLGTPGPPYANPLGVQWTGTPGYTGNAAQAREEEPGNTGFETSIWMTFWFLAEIHRLETSKLMAGHSTESSLLAFADFGAKLPARIVNESTGGEYRYQGKRTTIGTQGHATSTFDDTGNPNSQATWDLAYAYRRGAAPVASGPWYYNYGNVQTSYTVGTDWFAETTGSAASSYAIHLWQALVAAKERGATGADAAWTKVLANVTGLDTWRSGFKAEPREGNFPRTLTSGRFSNAKWPAWRKAMQAGTWTRIGAVMDSVNPLNNATLNPLGSGTVGTWQSVPDTANAYGGGAGALRGTEGFTAFVDDWSGAAYDIANDRLYVWGGGHNGYGGNEVISTKLDDTSPTWRIERPPTGWKLSASAGINLLDRREDLKLYSNGDPRSAHSYDMIALGNGGMYVMPSATFSEPSGVENTAASRIFKFTPGANPTVGTDASYGTWALTATLPSASIGYNWNSSSLTYDSTRNYLYAIGSGRAIYRYDVTNNVWLTNGPSTGTDSDHRSVYVPSLDLVVIFNYVVTGKFQVYKPSTNTIFTPGATGTTPAPTRSGTVGSSTLEYWSAANWVPELGAFVCWVEGGTGFHLLRPPVGDPTTNAWAWSRLEASAANTVTPDPRAPNGDYGRFFYSPRLKCLGVVTSAKASWPPGAPSTGLLNIFALP